LGKISPKQYAKINSSGASPRRIKNNNFIEIVEL
ncbi:MAG: putative transposase, partial [Gammaproteobacteria bacterium]